MKRFIKFLCLILVITLAFPLLSCKQKGSVVSFSCFNTLIRIETHDFAVSESDAQKIKDEFFRLENEFSVNKSQSFTYAFNNSDLNSYTDVSGEFINILKKCKELCVYTGGSFNPSVYPVLKLWQFTPAYPVDNFVLPTGEQISELNADYSFDLDSIIIDEQNLKLYKGDKNIQLDFGGILKGYALNKASDILRLSGHESGYISLGGSSVLLLSCNTLGVKNPENPNDLILSLNVKGCKNVSVSTSGVYERFYVYEGKTYSHIIDTASCRPADTGILSATVLLNDGTACDALSTALVCCPNTDDGLIAFMKKIISDYQNAQIYVVYNDGNTKQIITNKKESENFTLLDKSYTLVNI